MVSPYPNVENRWKIIEFDTEELILVLFVFYQSFFKPDKQKLESFPSCSLLVVQLDIAASLLNPPP